MRVLMQGRADLWVVRGGDTVHVARTAEALAALLPDVDVDVAAGLEVDPGGYDLVHLFNALRADEFYLAAEAAAVAGRPVVATPLWWDLPAMAREGAPVHDALLRRWPGEERLRTRALGRAEAVLVGGEGEGQMLLGAFPHLSAERVHVVPVGSDGLGAPAAGSLRERLGLAEYALSVARVGPHKNQLGLCRAAGELGIPLVLVGQPQDALYVRQCREGAPWVRFLGFLEEGLLAAAFAEARVHALPSWCELPGLSTLEAAAAGCQVVSTGRGTAREYLGDDAWYCDPSDAGSLRRALAAAWEAPPRPALAERARGFTWARAAAATWSVYQGVLAGVAGR